jgi:hypothetical protein
VLGFGKNIEEEAALSIILENITDEMNITMYKNNSVAKQLALTKNSSDNLVLEFSHDIKELITGETPKGSDLVNNEKSTSAGGSGRNLFSTTLSKPRKKDSHITFASSKTLRANAAKLAEPILEEDDFLDEAELMS